MRTRKIIHIDMDAFFAAVEQRDNPEYQHKPLIVGGLPNSRGVVATCSYEARKFGIHSAMPSSHARRLCPQAIFVKPRFEAYREASAIIRTIFSQYTDLFEPASLDEAYLDVSSSGHCNGSATLVAREIKHNIKGQTGLTASAGISYNKFLAKIASDMDKPDGLFLIAPEQGPEFVAQLAIGKFHGIGKATEAKMHGLGVFTGADLKRVPLLRLQHIFGKAGQYYYNISRGTDHRLVKNHRISKSIGVETTFQNDLENLDDILQQLQKLFAKALNKVSTKKMLARTVTLKIKYHDFEQITRSRTFNRPITSISDNTGFIQELLAKTDISHKKVRLLGITFSSLEKQASFSDFQQLDLFNNLKT
jgi:DNA polymerase-4